MELFFKQSGGGDPNVEILSEWIKTLSHYEPPVCGLLCVAADGTVFPWLCYNAGKLSDKVSIQDEEGNRVTADYVSPVHSGYHSDEPKSIPFPPESEAELKKLQCAIGKISPILGKAMRRSPVMNELQKLYWRFRSIPAVTNLYNMTIDFWKDFYSGEVALVRKIDEWEDIRHQISSIESEYGGNFSMEELKAFRNSFEALPVPEIREDSLKRFKACAEEFHYSTLGSFPQGSSVHQMGLAFIKSLEQPSLKDILEPARDFQQAAQVLEKDISKNRELYAEYEFRRECRNYLQRFCDGFKTL